MYDFETIRRIFEERRIKTKEECKLSSKVVGELDGYAYKKPIGDFDCNLIVNGARQTRNSTPAIGYYTYLTCILLKNLCLYALLNKKQLQ